MDRVNESSDALPACSESDCRDDAAFFVYDADSDGWRAICTAHARRLHPSLEVHAWLESGYMKPAELGKPDEPPSDPRIGRERAFRAEVAQTMGWSDGSA